MGSPPLGWGLRSIGEDGVGRLVTAGGAMGVAFGAGASCMTTPDTDDGHFTTRAAAYFAAPRPPSADPRL